MATYSVIPTFAYLLKVYRLHYYGVANSLPTHKLRLRLTQKELADMVHVDRAFMNQLEKGNRKPSYELVGDIAKALHLNSYETNNLHASAGYLPPCLKYKWPMRLEIALNGEHTNSESAP